MSDKEVFVIRRKRILLWLLALQLLPLLLAMLTFYLVPQFEEIFKDVLGDDVQLPVVTQVFFRSYWFSFLIPLGLVLFSVWACLKAKSAHPAMFIMVATILGSAVYSFLLFIALFLPFLKLVNSLQM